MACRAPREIVTGYLSQPCTIRSVVRTSDTQGGTTEEWQDTAETVCHVTKARQGDAHEQPVADRLRGRPAYLVRLPYEAEVKLNDRIVTDGATLDVVSVSRPPNGFATLVMCAGV